MFLGPWLPSFIFKAGSAVVLRPFICHHSSLGRFSRFFFFFFFQSNGCLNFLSIYLSLVVLGLCCCRWAFSGCSGEGGSSLRRAGFSLWRLLLCSVGSGTDSLQQSWLTGLVAPWHVESSRTKDRTHVPVLAGEFLSTVRPGKSILSFLFFKFIF